MEKDTEKEVSSIVANKAMDAFGRITAITENNLEVHNLGHGQIVANTNIREVILPVPGNGATENWSFSEVTQPLITAQIDDKLYIINYIPLN